MNYFAKGPAVKLCDATTGHAVHSVAFCENSETAEFIVRAVNSHQALIDALELAMSTLAGCAPVSIPEADRANAIKGAIAALKLAKGES